VLSQSQWFGFMARNPLTLVSLANDGFLNSMIIGYEGSSLFDYLTSLPHFLEPTKISQALNMPTWSLHVEFWGSMLVLSLAMFRRFFGDGWFYAIFIIAAFLTGTSHFSLFLFGFLLYQLHGTLLRQRHISGVILGAVLALSGMYICIYKDVHVVNQILDGLNHVTLLNARHNFYWQSQVGAMLIFSGVMLNAPLRNLFTGHITQWFGKVSFSVYLLHFPILLTVGSLVFSLLAQSSYALACTVASMTGIGTTFIAAAMFEKYIDQRAVLFSKRMIDELNTSHEAMKVTAEPTLLK